MNPGGRSDESAFGANATAASPNNGKENETPSDKEKSDNQGTKTKSDTDTSLKNIQKTDNQYLRIKSSIKNKPVNNIIVPSFTSEWIKRIANNDKYYDSIKVNKDDYISEKWGVKPTRDMEKWIYSVNKYKVLHDYVKLNLIKDYLYLKKDDELKRDAYYDNLMTSTPVANIKNNIKWVSFDPETYQIILAKDAPDPYNILKYSVDYVNDILKNEYYNEMAEKRPKSENPRTNEGVNYEEEESQNTASDNKADETKNMSQEKEENVDNESMKNINEDIKKMKIYEELYKLYKIDENDIKQKDIDNIRGLRSVSYPISESSNDEKLYIGYQPPMGESGNKKTFGIFIKLDSDSKKGIPERYYKVDINDNPAKIILSYVLKPMFEGMESAISDDKIDLKTEIKKNLIQSLRNLLNSDNNHPYLNNKQVSWNKYLNHIKAKDNIVTRIMDIKNQNSYWDRLLNMNMKGLWINYGRNVFRIKSRYIKNDNKGDNNKADNNENNIDVDNSANNKNSYIKEYVATLSLPTGKRIDIPYEDVMRVIKDAKDEYAHKFPFDPFKYNVIGNDEQVYNIVNKIGDLNTFVAKKISDYIINKYPYTEVFMDTPKMNKIYGSILDYVKSKPRYFNDAYSITYHARAADPAYNTIVIEKRINNKNGKDTIKKYNISVNDLLNYMDKYRKNNPKTKESDYDIIDDYVKSFISDKDKTESYDMRKLNAKSKSNDYNDFTLDNMISKIQDPNINRLHIKSYLNNIHPNNYTPYKKILTTLEDTLKYIDENYRNEKDVHILNRIMFHRLSDEKIDVNYYKSDIKPSANDILYMMDNPKTPLVYIKSYLNDINPSKYKNVLNEVLNNIKNKENNNESNNNMDMITNMIKERLSNKKIIISDNEINEAVKDLHEMIQDPKISMLAIASYLNLLNPKDYDIWHRLEDERNSMYDFDKRSSAEMNDIRDIVEKKYNDVIDELNKERNKNDNNLRDNDYDVNENENEDETPDKNKKKSDDEEYKDLSIKYDPSSEKDVWFSVKVIRDLKPISSIPVSQPQEVIINIPKSYMLRIYSTYDTLSKFAKMNPIPQLDNQSKIMRMVANSLSFDPTRIKRYFKRGENNIVIVDKLIKKQADITGLPTKYYEEYVKYVLVASDDNITKVSNISRKDLRTISLWSDDAITHRVMDTLQQQFIDITKHGTANNDYKKLLGSLIDQPAGNWKFISMIFDYVYDTLKKNKGEKLTDDQKNYAVKMYRRKHRENEWGLTKPTEVVNFLQQIILYGGKKLVDDIFNIINAEPPEEINISEKDINPHVAKRLEDAIREVSERKDERNKNYISPHIMTALKREMDSVDTSTEEGKRKYQYLNKAFAYLVFPLTFSIAKKIYLPMERYTYSQNKVNEYQREIFKDKLAASIYGTLRAIKEYNPNSFTPFQAVAKRIIQNSILNESQIPMSILNKINIVDTVMKEMEKNGLMEGTEKYESELKRLIEEKGLTWNVFNSYLMIMREYEKQHRTESNDEDKRDDEFH